MLELKDSTSPTQSRSSILHIMSVSATLLDTIRSLANKDLCNSLETKPILQQLNYLSLNFKNFSLFQPLFSNLFRAITILSRFNLVTTTAEYVEAAALLRKPV